MPIGFIPGLENMLNANRVPEALTFLFTEGIILITMKNGLSRYLS